MNIHSSNSMLESSIPQNENVPTNTRLSVRNLLDSKYIKAMQLLQEIEECGNVLSVSPEEYSQYKEYILPDELVSAVKKYLTRFVGASLIECETSLSNLSDIQKQGIAFCVKVRKFKQEALAPYFQPNDSYYDFLKMSPRQLIEEYIADTGL